MAPGYFAPAFSVQINGQKLSADIEKNITNVSVVDQPGTIDSCSLTVANPYPTLRWTHVEKDAPLFSEGNDIQVKLGYVDNLELLFQGKITTTSANFPESGSPTVTIQAQSELYRLSLGTRTQTFKDVTDKQIVEQFARDNGLTAEVDDTEITYPYVLQHGKTDLQFLRERAERIDFELLVEGKTLKFRRRQFTKLYKLVWGHPKQDIDPFSTTMPLRSFNPTLRTLGQVSRVVVRGQHPTTRAVIEGVATQSNQEHKMGGKQTGPEAAAQALGHSSELVLVNQPVTSQQEAEQLASTLLKDHARKFVTGSGATIGLPKLRTGQLVDIDGLGFRFNGEYYVTQVTHTLGGGGYLTTFAVQRNSIG